MSHTGDFWGGIWGHIMQEHRMEHEMHWAWKKRQETSPFISIQISLVSTRILAGTSLRPKKLNLLLPGVELELTLLVPTALLANRRRNFLNKFRVLQIGKMWANRQKCIPQFLWITWWWLRCRASDPMDWKRIEQFAYILGIVWKYFITTIFCGEDILA